MVGVGEDVVEVVEVVDDFVTDDEVVVEDLEVDVVAVFRVVGVGVIKQEHPEDTLDAG